MKKPDGSLCSTSAENAEVFQKHFEQLFTREATFDLTVLDSLPQHDIVEGCDHIPTNDEIKEATLKLRNTAPGNSGIRPQIWKSLLQNPKTQHYLQVIVRQIWITEIIPNDWSIGKGILGILPRSSKRIRPCTTRTFMAHPAQIWSST